MPPSLQRTRIRWFVCLATAIALPVESALADPTLSRTCLTAECGSGLGVERRGDFVEGKGYVMAPGQYWNPETDPVHTAEFASPFRIGLKALGRLFKRGGKKQAARPVQRALSSEGRKKLDRWRGQSAGDRQSLLRTRSARLKTLRQSGDKRARKEIPRLEEEVAILTRLNAGRAATRAGPKTGSALEMLKHPAPWALGVVALTSWLVPEGSMFSDSGSPASGAAPLLAVDESMSDETTAHSVARIGDSLVRVATIECPAGTQACEQILIVPPTPEEAKRMAANPALYLRRGPEGEWNSLPLNAGQLELLSTLGDSERFLREPPRHGKPFHE